MASTLDEITKLLAQTTPGSQTQTSSGGQVSQTITDTGATTTGTTSTSGRTDVSTTSGRTDVQQLMLSDEDVNLLVNKILESNQGLASVTSGEKAAGLYGATTTGTMAGNLVARAAAEAEAKRAPLVTKIGGQTTTNITGGTTGTTSSITGPSTRTAETVTGPSTIKTDKASAIDMGDALRKAAGLGLSSMAIDALKNYGISGLKSYLSSGTGATELRNLGSSLISPGVAGGLGAGTAAPLITAGELGAAPTALGSDVWGMLDSFGAGAGGATASAADVASLFGGGTADIGISSLLEGGSAAAGFGEAAGGLAAITGEELGLGGAALSEAGWAGLGGMEAAGAGAAEAGAAAGAGLGTVASGAGAALGYYTSMAAPIAITGVIGKALGIKELPHCFITTSVCKYSNKPDDCEELQVLRAFRDTYMRASPERQTKVDQYYNEAPGIVATIEAIPDGFTKRHIYTTMYKEFIVPALEAIYGDQNHTAELYYTALFNYAAAVAADHTLGE